MRAEGSDLGIDAGGTFTDFVTADGRVLKLPSDATSPGGVLEEGTRSLFCGAQKPGPRDRALDVVHGTTVATNAMLTGKLAKVGLLTTAGFRDILTLGRQARPELYALHPERSFEPPLPKFVAEVPERMSAQGRVVLALDEEALLAAVKKLQRAGVETLAVCFLHAWRNPKHERRAAAILESSGLPVTTSSALVPEFREFERFSTAYANAALMPLLAHYTSDLESRLPSLKRALAARAAPRFSILASDGGRCSLKEAAAEPVKLVLSGPAGGVVGAWRTASSKSRRRLMTLDLGGTSADVALLDGGEPVVNRCEIAGRPLLMPVVDVHTVGAGGGSVARRDAGGALAVGPISAGAKPGPAAYGQGGPATVTDAHIVLGRLPAAHFLGGTFDLDVDASRRVVAELARELSLDTSRCAEGILRVADVTMERALRRISLERGHDPRRFSLVAFGGAGALHAASIARGLDMPEVVVPPDAGLLSARGMLRARVKKERSIALVDRTFDDVETDLDRFGAPLKKALQKSLLREGVAEADQQFEYWADLRYVGQSHEIGVPMDRGRGRRNFHEAHQKLYGFAETERPIEIVALRLRGCGPEPRAARRRKGRKLGSSSAAIIDQAEAIFDGKMMPTPIMNREDLPAGKKRSGPAIVVEYSATTVVPPDFEFFVDDRDCLVLERRR